MKQKLSKCGYTSFFGLNGGRVLIPRNLVAILIIALAALCAGCSGGDKYEEAYRETGKALYEQTAEPVSGSVGGEWAVIGLARSDYDADESWFDTYVKNTETYVKEKKGVLHSRTGYQYTEYARIILGFTAAGADPADVAGCNFLEKLTDMENVCRQGTNGPIWALIAYDSGSYEIPAASGAAEQTSREKLVQAILDRQLADGGWSISSGASAQSDADMTAMALQALAPYYLGEGEFTAEISADLTARVKTAADAALDFLSAQQNEEGGFSSFGESSAESSCQVVTALSSLGIDADTDERFIKGENSALDGLLAFYDGEGGFYHTDGETAANPMATEQAYYALTAYDRFLSGESPLYRMR